MNNKCIKKIRNDILKVLLKLTLNYFFKDSIQDDFFHKLKKRKSFIRSVCNLRNTFMLFVSSLTQNYLNLKRLLNDFI